ncbi:FcoT family thioesterase [Algibacillus agarilyticus]|uniref:FcoT family thioesterase n=1 Tax=Algibacillus agarilyticus TaxID=2234133 RepID=UPI000DCF6CDF|nr:FcoT family thioesterase [Algibacillus agarilyticus]
MLTAITQTTQKAKSPTNDPLLIEPTLLKQVLKPYFSHSTYLKSAVIDDVNSEALVTARGQFAIEKSCYIDDTGHFNAVEFNICFNQLSYVIVAQCIESGIFKALNPKWAALCPKTLQDFFEDQLATILISKLESKFLRPLNSRAFEGLFTVDKLSVIKGRLFMHTSIAFYDEQGIAAKGNVLACYVPGLKEVNANAQSH